MNFEDIDRIFLENWMQLLSESISHKKIRDLFIPGSHDANTNSISMEEMGSAFARCQNISIEKQAHLGIRFFDLRYGPGKSSHQVLDKHGPFKGTDFYENFESLKRFSEKHPDEFLVITIQAEAEMLAKTKKEMIRKISGILYDKLVTSLDCNQWFDVGQVTLAQVWKTKKRFLLIARDELWTGSGFTEEACAKIGIHNRNRIIVNTFHDTADEETLFRKNMANLSLKLSVPKLLFASQFVLTIQNDPKFVLSSLINMDMPTIVNFVSKLHHCSKLSRFIFDHLDQPFNLFLFDHIEYDLDLLRIVISANMSETIKIHKVFLGDRELTGMLEDNFANGKSFYVTSIAKLADLFPSKFTQLFVIYSFADSDLRFQFSNRKKDTFLISNNPIFQQKPKIGEKVYLVWRNDRKFKCRVYNHDLDDLFCDQICSDLKVNSLIKITGKVVRHYKYSTM